MTNVINFKQAGKKVTRIKKENRAKENRVKHGQKKLTRHLIKRTGKALETHLDGHKMDDPRD
ncbi:MAG: DUF4169 domain-containing protein [Alphaproteobacteria bacterium]|nr:MAG: DUF4169 domain-containing protein [Alphaproteobacteria bacterium]